MNSRHNIGFSVIKALCQLLGISLKKDNETFSLVGKGKIRNKIILLAMPLTFMNLSGLAVSTLVKKYRLHLSELLVVCDDLDLRLGRLKIRPCGSCGGHRGLESIIGHLKTNKFSRLRIGIGRPGPNIDAAEYVLSGFNRDEKRQVKEMITDACGCCQSWVLEGITKSMNIFNRREKE